MKYKFRQATEQLSSHIPLTSEKSEHSPVCLPEYEWKFCSHKFKQTDKSLWERSNESVAYTCK
jgi:hypothetical protein